MIAGARIAMVAERAQGAGTQATSDLTVLLAGVAAALRAGNSPAESWRRRRVRLTADGVPIPMDIVRAVSDGSGPTMRRVWARAAISTPDRDADGRVRQAVAIATVCAIANELGSPLAEVLDETSASILVYQQGVAARRGALAGPRMSARVLMWLPLGTCALGTLFGASPWRVLLDGGIGTLSLMAGLFAMLIGRAWVARLVARATTPGGPVRGTGPP